MTRTREGRARVARPSRWVRPLWGGLGVTLLGLGLVLSLTSFFVSGLGQPVQGEAVQNREAALVSGLQPAARSVWRSVVDVVDEGGRRVGYGVVVGDGEVVAGGLSLAVAALDRSTRSRRRRWEPRTAPSVPEKLHVRDRSGRLHSASLISMDKNNALAMLRAPTLRAPALDLEQVGTADVRRGRLVISVGSERLPIAAGMVSAVGRTISGKEEYEPVPIRAVSPGQEGPKRTEVRFFPKVLQHDSLLGLTELGSLLVSVEGEVLGINVANVLHGTSYAVPVAEILEVLPGLRSGRSVEGKSRGFLGVATRAASVSLLRRLRVPGAVVVDEVIPGHAAERAGILRGDAILAVDGRPILDHGDLVQLVSAREPGEPMIFRIARGDRVFDASIRIGETDWER